MITQTHVTQNKFQSPISNGFVVILLSIAIFLSQAFPAMSKSTSMWIEICIDGGSYMAEIDFGGSDHSQECTHCEICTLPALDPLDTATLISSPAFSLIFSVIDWRAMRAALPGNPEQYWSACRGPPLLGEENKMTLAHTTYYDEIIARPLNLRGAPWL